MKQTISKPARERLIKLARLMELLENESCFIITSSEIQKKTGWTDATIRRDISFLDADCATPNGYDVSLLRSSICKELGLDADEKRCCIVGLGKLGSALLEYSGFSGTLFKIVAGFDSSANRCETLKADFPLYPTSRMSSVIKSEKIEYAILTVPEKYAQETAIRLVQMGIKGIVNYTSAVLTVPDDVCVENISVLDALQKIAASQKSKII